MSDFDPDAWEAAHPTVKAASPTMSDFDPDAWEAAHPQSKAIPLSPERKAVVDQQIQAGMLPVPGGARTLAEAFRESNQSAGQSLADQTLGGIPGRLMRATGTYGDQVQPIPTPGRGAAHRPEDYIPDERALASLPAAALDMATVGGAFGKAGQTLGGGATSLARGLGAKVGPGLQAAVDNGATGALYSGADTAVRGGSPGEVLASMPYGAGAGVAMGALPAIAEGAEGVLSRKVAANDLRPIKQMSKKGTLDKELIQFGDGNPEEGKKEMLSFVQRENLGPILREKGQNAIDQFEAKKNDVYETDLEPIYRIANKAEPHASVPFEEIASRLRSNISKRGGNEHRLVEQSIDEIKKRSDLVSKSGEVPLDVVLTNARDFQSTGHAGVVNYDDTPESKKTARKIGWALRQIANERVADIYTRNPEAAQELFTKQQPKGMGVTFRDQPSTPGMARAEDYPTAWARRYQNFQAYAADVPRVLAEGNKRYSDYAKMEPLVRQASVLKAGEKKFGFMNMLGHGVSGTIGGAVGAYFGGIPGAIAGAGAVEAGRASYPYALRGANSLASGLAGAPTSSLAGALVTKPLQRQE
jgi:hypothetical protein